MFDLPFDPAAGTHHTATKSDDTYNARALTATLEMVALEAQSTLERVRATTDPDEYQPLVMAAIGSLEQQTSYAAANFEAYRGKDKQQLFMQTIQRATKPIDGLLRFVEARQNNRAMLERFAGVKATTNKLRTAVKLGRIEEIEGGKTGKEDASASNELTRMSTARGALTSALTTLTTRIEAAADQFYELAKLEDPPDEDALWTELVKGLVISLLGNVVGAKAGELLTRLAGTHTTKVLDVTETLVPNPLNAKYTVKKTVLGKGGDAINNVGDKGQGLMSGSTTDLSQSWAGTLAQAETATKADKLAKNKAALFFKKSLVLGADNTRSKIEQDINKRQNARDISASEIEGMAAGIARDAANAFSNTLTSAARDFSLMFAQQSLGADASPKAKPGDKKTTRIGRDYQFGEGWTDGARTTAEGIARIRIHLTHRGPSIDRYELVGMNQHLTKLVHNGARGRIGSLGVPTEIELSSDRSNHKEMLVVDENKAIRFKTGWNLFRVPEVLAIASGLATPEKAWTTLQDYTIPDTFKIETDK
jgi:hypothetical protein